MFWLERGVVLVTILQAVFLVCLCEPSTLTLPSEVPGIMVGSGFVMVDVARTIRILIPDFSACNTCGSRSMGVTGHSTGVVSSGVLSASPVKLVPQLLFALLTQASVTRPRVVATSKSRCFHIPGGGLAWLGEQPMSK